jgi:hypothetical protein
MPTQWIYYGCVYKDVYINTPKYIKISYLSIIPRARFTVLFFLYNETNLYIEVIYFLKYNIVYSILIIILCVRQEISIFW